MIPNNEYTSNNEHFEQPEIKSSLPSRSEIHRKKKKKSKESKKSKKSKVKIKFLLIKLLVLFFILLPIGFYYVYTYLQDRPVYNQKSAESANDWSSSIKMQPIQSYNDSTFKK